MSNQKIKKTSNHTPSKVFKESKLSTARIQDFLDSFYIRYKIHTNIVADSTNDLLKVAASLDTCVVKVVLFSDERGPILSVYPAKDGLDMEKLNSVTDRNLALDLGHQFKPQLQGFSVRHLPPFGRLFQMMMVIDERLFAHGSFLIDIGKQDCFLELNRKDFEILIKGSALKQFSLQIPDKKQDYQTRVIAPNEGVDIASLFCGDDALPVMPNIGKQLIALKCRGNYDLGDLVILIESDPVLSAKIIAYASSSFFSYQGKLASVQEAIYHVLGSVLSLNIALALVLGGQFKGPMKGQVGAISTWRHAVYCAVLCQSLTEKIQNQPSLQAGNAYLHGLLHNIGFLALGHVFPGNMAKLNHVLQSNLKQNLETVENEILGVTHTKAGGALLKTWKLPDEYRVVVENHHDVEYLGDHEVYSHIVFMANVLLKRVNIGDASDDLIPGSILAKYNLTESELQELLEGVLQWHESIDLLAHQLVA